MPPLYQICPPDATTSPSGNVWSFAPTRLAPPLAHPARTSPRVPPSTRLSLLHFRFWGGCVSGAPYIRLEVWRPPPSFLKKKKLRKRKKKEAGAIHCGGYVSIFQKVVNSVACRGGCKGSARGELSRGWTGFCGLAAGEMVAGIDPDGPAIERGPGANARAYPGRYPMAGRCKRALAVPVWKRHMLELVL